MFSGKSRYLPEGLWIVPESTGDRLLGSARVFPGTRLCFHEFANFSGTHSLPVSGDLENLDLSEINPAALFIEKDGIWFFIFGYFFSFLPTIQQSYDVILFYNDVIGWLEDTFVFSKKGRFLVLERNHNKILRGEKAAPGF